MKLDDEVRGLSSKYLWFSCMWFSYLGLSHLWFSYSTRMGMWELTWQHCARRPHCIPSLILLAASMLM
jgi:hypothetical protein